MHPNHQTDWSHKIGMVFNPKIFRFYENTFFKSNTHTWPTYKKTPSLIRSFIKKKLIFQINRDPCVQHLDKPCSMPGEEIISISKSISKTGSKVQCFHKRNIALRTWRSKALQWGKCGLLSKMRPKCGPILELLRT